MAPRRSGRGKQKQSVPALTMDDDEESDIDQPRPQQVSLDLQSSESEDGSSEDESDSEQEGKQIDNDEDDDDDSEDEDNEINSDEDDSEDDDVDPETVWGRSSSQYYAGDTADLEIGQDFEEAKEEEAIAAKLQKKKRATEDESDYLIMDPSMAVNEDGDEEEDGGDWQEAKSLRDLSKMDDAAQLKVILAESPELRGLLDQMRKYLDELSLLGLALDEAHMGQAEAVSTEGLAYLELRNHLLLSFVMNVNFYLLLKSEGKSVRDHPVVAKLLKLQKAINKLSPLEEQGEEAVGYLVNTAAGAVLGGGEEEEDDEDDEEDEEEESEEEVQEEESEEEEEDEEELAAQMEEEKSAKKLRRLEEKRLKRDLKFQQKSSQLIEQSMGSDKKSKSDKKRSIGVLGNDMGDIEGSGSATKVQAMMNTMIQKQKSKKNKADRLSGDEEIHISETKAPKKQTSVVGSLEQGADNDDFFGGGDEMEDMGDEFGDSDENAEDFFRPLKAKKSMGDDPADQFYQEVKAASSSRNKMRKEKYGATRLVAGAHLKELDDEAKRATPYQIIKNRGLVAHKSKINRNPRVKKREQFRKATIRRKGQVRDIRDSAEGAHYQGEATGIRTNISRSRAITN